MHSPVKSTRTRYPYWLVRFRKHVAPEVGPYYVQYVYIAKWHDNMLTGKIDLVEDRRLAKRFSQERAHKIAKFRGAKVVRITKKEKQ